MAKRKAGPTRMDMRRMAEAAEARDDRDADRAALALYRRMAERWALDLPPLP